ncbi:MAG: hypothetical protein QM811_04700 [Pirellulales bacterium]
MSSRTKSLVAVFCILLVGVGAWAWMNRRIYPEVTSAESLRLIKLMYTAANTKNVKLLTNFEKELAAAVRAKHVGDDEATAFAGIAQTAREGDWKSAEQAAYRFALDQRRDR